MVSLFHLSILSIASAFTLVAESRTEEVNGLKAYSIEEEASKRIFFLGEEGEQVFTDDSTHLYTKGDDSNSTKYFLDIEDSILLSTPEGNGQFDIAQDYVQYNSVNSFTACKKVGDATGHSEDHYAITYPPTGEDCVAIFLRAVDDVSTV